MANKVYDLSSMDSIKAQYWVLLHQEFDQLLYVGKYTSVPRQGICAVVEIIFPDIWIQYRVLDSLKRLWMQWEDFSGSISFPVPACSSVNNEQAEFFRTSDMWSGPYGKKRKELVKFLNQRIRDWLIYRIDGV